jgi:hypothetical protein
MRFGRGISFTRFLKLVNDLDFPLEEFGDRVAVIGAGDSGSCVVEYLLGQGPPSGLDVASTAFPKRIDWYGQECLFKEDYDRYARSRYAGIGRYMPRLDEPNYYARVFPTRARALSIERGNVVFYRDGAKQPRRSGPYDSIIVCSGFNETDALLTPGVTERPIETVEVDGLPVAKRYSATQVYRVGPAADLPVTNIEKEENKVLEKVPQNSVALFRYNRRTQLLAEYLA